MAKTRKIVKHLRSRESSEIGHELVPAKPMPSQMVEGEIAMNYLEGYERLYIKNSNGDVVTFYPNGNVTVDDELSSVSENPVQNKVITEALEQIVAGGVVVDDQLSDSSTNPVQNRVITGALNKVEQVLDNGDDEGYFPVLMTPKTTTEISGDEIDITKYSEYLTYSPDDKILNVPQGKVNVSTTNATTLIEPGVITFDSDVTIDADNYGGNAATATNATNDGDGNNIVDTYATKEDLLSDELVTAAALTKMNDAAGFDNSGNYAPNGTNYIGNATSLSEAVDLLDDAIANINVNSAIANYLENNGINGGEYYGS